MSADAKEGRVPLHLELARAFVGAIADCEALVASDRARWLQGLVGLSSTALRWGAWCWFALLVLSVVAVPVLRDTAGIAAARLDHRDALFVVLAVSLAGPIVLGRSVWLGLFAYRVLVDLAGKRVPRVFRLLTAPIVGLVLIAVVWSYRLDLRVVYWRAFREFLDVLKLAGGYSPLSGGL